MSSKRLINSLIFCVLIVGCSDQEKVSTIQDVGVNNTNNHDVGIIDAEDGDNDADGDVDSNNSVSVCPYATTLKIAKNRCATPNDLGPTWQSGALNPAPNDLGLAVQWTYDNQCPTSSNALFRAAVVHGDLVSVMDYAGSIITLDQATGEEQNCEQFYQYADGVLLAWPERSQLITLTMDGLREAEQAVRWSTFDPTDSEAPVERFMPGCSSSGHDFRVTPDGQILVRTTFTQGIMSIDPVSGEVNWVVDDADLKSLIPPTIYNLDLHFREMGFDKTTRELIIQLTPAVTVGIDSCGVIRVRDGISATVVDFGDGHLELTDSRIRVIAADGQVQEDEECIDVVSLSEDTYACTNASPINQLALTLFQAGQPKVERLITLPSTSNLFDTVATRDGLLLIPSTRGIEFYDWRTDVFIGFFEKPFEHRYQMGIHDVGANGQMIVHLGAKIFAIDSNLTGIAPGPYPRGFRAFGGVNLPAW